MSVSDMVFSRQQTQERQPSDLKAFQSTFGFVEPLMYHCDEHLNDSVKSVSMRVFASVSKKITARCDNPASYKVERIALKLIIKVGALIANAALFCEFAIMGTATLGVGLGYLLSKGVRKISHTTKTDDMHDFFEKHVKSLGSSMGGALKDALIMTAMNVGTNTIGVVAQLAVMGVPDTQGARIQSIDQLALHSTGQKPKENES